MDGTQLCFCAHSNKLGSEFGQVLFYFELNFHSNCAMYVYEMGIISTLLLVPILGLHCRTGCLRDLCFLYA